MYIFSFISKVKEKNGAVLTSSFVAPERTSEWEDVAEGGTV